MRKIIGFLIIIASVTMGLYLHDKYFQTLLKEEEIANGHVAKLQLDFINDQILPTSWPGDKNPIGGLSGLAWSGLNQVLYAISDDRGRSGPSRFYGLQLRELKDHHFEVQVQNVFPIRTRSGQLYPKRSLDPEGIAVDSAGWIYISSEGDFEETPSAVPTLIQVNKKGEEVRRTDFGPPFFPIEKEKRAKTYGVRDNLAFESLDYDPDLKALVTTTESALIQDGDVADFEKGTQTRITYYHVDVEGALTESKQVVYPLSAIPARDPVPASIIGVPDLVILNENELLVLERAYLAARSKNRIRLFLVNCEGATNVAKMDSLKNQQITTCKKELLYDFDLLIGQLSEEYPVVDNIEGMDLGPKLPDGSRLLIFVSDNNFRDAQRTQFLFFKMR
ncbi:MAG: esterase-like activity of phytase family protein [Bdellovibrionales bacterium]|nr:esterase-like activity of phytase family protein [Bdellovibrionales bacterium]